MTRPRAGWALLLAALVLAPFLAEPSAGAAGGVALSGPGAVPMGAEASFLVRAPGASPPRLSLDGMLVDAALEPAGHGTWRVALRFAESGERRLLALQGDEASPPLRVVVLAPPAPPADVVAEPLSDQLRVAVKWAYYRGDASRAPSSYRLERLGADGEWSAVAETLGGTRRVLDRATFEGHRTYRVVAVNLAGESAPSAPVNATVATPASILVPTIQEFVACSAWSCDVLPPGATLHGGGAVYVRVSGLLRVDGQAAPAGVRVNGTTVSFERGDCARCSTTETMGWGVYAREGGLFFAQLGPFELGAGAGCEPIVFTTRVAASGLSGGDDARLVVCG